ncbi:hypothetical protein NEIG_00469 [Nematocida sp. ERTm5]|nr:hypothetical protein NEIG_00469 [Nematocida sp. ERTm5]
MGSTTSKCISNSLHVIKVRRQSAADRYGILPVLHYIVEINGQSISNEKDILRITESWETGKVQLLMYDVRSKKEFLLDMVRENGEKIGFSIKFHRGERAPYTFRVLDVEYNSPALESGLRKDEDYIIGHGNGGFSWENEFENMLINHKGGPVVLLVYNIGMLSIRKVEIYPTPDGEIGCSLGGGILNEVPYTDASIDLVEEVVKPSRAAKCISPAMPMAVYTEAVSGGNEQSVQETVQQPLQETNEQSLQRTVQPPLQETANTSAVQGTSEAEDTESVTDAVTAESSLQKSDMDGSIAYSEETNEYTVGGMPVESALAEKVQDMQIQNTESDQRMHEYGVNSEFSLDTQQGMTDEIADELNSEIRGKMLEEELHQSLYETMPTDEVSDSFKSQALEDEPVSSPTVDHISRISSSDYKDILDNYQMESTQDNLITAPYEYNTSANLASNMLNGQGTEMYDYINAPTINHAEYTANNVPYEYVKYKEYDSRSAPYTEQVERTQSRYSKYAPSPERTREQPPLYTDKSQMYEQPPMPDYTQDWNNFERSYTVDNSPDELEEYGRPAQNREIEYEQRPLYSKYDPRDGMAYEHPPFNNHKEEYYEEKVTKNRGSHEKSPTSHDVYEKVSTHTEYKKPDSHSDSTKKKSTTHEEKSEKSHKDNEKITSTVVHHKKIEDSHGKPIKETVRKTVKEYAPPEKPQPKEKPTTAINQAYNEYNFPPHVPNEVPAPNTFYPSEFDESAPGPLAGYIPSQQAYNMLNGGPAPDDVRVYPREEAIQEPPVGNPSERKNKRDPFYLQPGDAGYATDDFFK